MLMIASYIMQQINTLFNLSVSLRLFWKGLLLPQPHAHMLRNTKLDRPGHGSRWEMFSEHSVAS